MMVHSAASGSVPSEPVVSADAQVAAELRAVALAVRLFGLDALPAVLASPRATAPLGTERSGVNP